MESALELCRKGKAVGYFPEFVIYMHNQNVKPRFQLKEFACPLTLKERLQSVYLIVPKNREEQSFHRALAKSLRSLISLSPY